MTSSSPLEQAIQAISATGWMLKSLGRSPFDSAAPWTCELYPGHFGGSYYQGTRRKSAQYTVWTGAMTTVLADGATPLDAVRNALAKLDKSDVKAVYEDLERAFEDWLDATQAARDRR